MATPKPPPQDPAVPDELVAALDACVSGTLSLERTCWTLGTCAGDDVGVARAAQRHLRALHEAGQLDEDAFVALMSVLGSVVTEDVPTDWSEDVARAHPVSVSNGDTGEHAQVVNSLLPGAVLRERYVLYGRVTTGPMGDVFKALDRRREESGSGDPWVAIKIVPAGGGAPSRALQALRRDAACGQRLTHPNIVRIFDLDQDGPHAFLTMEWLEGESLAKLLDRRHRALPRPQSMQIIEDICRALNCAHEHRLAHADVKPGNIFITADGRAHLLDFGIARDLDGPAAEQARGHTPQYASPEVLAGDAPTAADDLFSLACVGYRMLAGRRAFGRLTSAQAVAADVRPMPIENLPAAQWRALNRALAFSRADRQPDVNSFLAELKGPRAARVPGATRGERNDGEARRWWQRPLAAVSAEQWFDRQRLADILESLQPKHVLGAGFALLLAVAAGIITLRDGPSAPEKPVSPAASNELRDAVSAVTRSPATAADDDAEATVAVPPIPSGTSAPRGVISRPAAPRTPAPADFAPPGIAPGVTTIAPSPAPISRSAPAPSAPIAAPPARVVMPQPAKAPVAAPAPAQAQASAPDLAPAPAIPSVASPALSQTPAPVTTQALAVPSRAADVPSSPSSAPTPSTGATPLVPFETLILQRFVEPEYPRRAAVRNRSGWVEVEFTVNRDGRTQDARVIAAEPRNRFDAAALAAVRRWRFEPGEGYEESARTRVRLRFEPE
jgi:TonB family protein